jgi:DNA-binding transcriptional MerR regulator
MPPLREGLTSQQERAIVALMTCRTVVAAAKQAEVAENTLRYWMTKVPAFKARYRETCEATTNLALAPLHAVVADAIAALARNLKKPAPPQTQVRAAVAVLQQVSGVQALQRMEAEIQELREIVERAQLQAAPDRGEEAEGAGEDGSAPGQAGHPPPAGGGPDAGDDRGGDGAGPLAAGADPLDGPADRGALHPPGGEEPGGGGQGAGPLLD